MNVLATRNRCWLFGSFLALSLADLYLTWRLFEVEGTGAAEQNPVADWVLDHYGWAGVAFLKLCTVLVVGVVASAVYRAWPRTGTGLLAGCCALLGSVVLYSSLLLYFPGTVAAESRDLEHAMVENNRVLDSEMQKTTERIHIKNRLAKEVLEQRRPLAEAVTAVEAVEEPGSVRIQHMRWLYPGCTDQQCLAVNLMEFALMQCRDQPAAMEPLRQELAKAYEASYGAPVPGCWWDVSKKLMAYAPSYEAPTGPEYRPARRTWWFPRRHRQKSA